MFTGLKNLSPDEYLKPEILSENCFLSSRSRDIIYSAHKRSSAADSFALYPIATKETT